MSFTLLDAAVIAVILISTILAYSRGIVRESMSLIGWIIALIVAAQFAPLMVPLFDNIEFIQNYLENSCELKTVIGFVILFIIMMVIMSLITPLFSNWVQNTALGLVDRALGGAFGLVRGILIILLAFVVYDKFIAPSTKVPMIEESRSYAMFHEPRSSLENSLPTQNDAPQWLVDQFNRITKDCRVDTTNA